jgi:hypothetical protein
MRGFARLLNRIRQLGFVRLALGERREAIEQDGRVLQLFRNRIELKKSYSSVLEEVQRLKDRLKQQEGATVRVQEMLQGLEARLSQPDSAYPAMIFYQLRDLWDFGRRLLQQFAGELEAQQLERERRNFFAEFNRRQFGRRQAVEADLLAAESAASLARARASDLERQLGLLNRFWHYFRRRGVRQALHAAGLQALLAEQALGEARSARDQLEGEQAEFGGLSVEARRAINLAVVAYGQVLLDRLERTGLYQHTRSATERREPAAGDYGDRAQCERLMADVQRARTLLAQRGDVLNEIRMRADTMRKVTRYRDDADTTPDADVLAQGEVGVATRVLVDDAWEIYRVLLR